MNPLRWLSVSLTLATAEAPTVLSLHLELILAHNFLRNLFPSSLVAHANICVIASCMYPSFLNASTS